MQMRSAKTVMAAATILLTTAIKGITMDGLSS